MVIRSDIAERVEQLLAGPIAGAGCRLLEVQFHEGPTTVLRLLVDREPAVGLEELSAVSELAGRILDVEDPISMPYSLEVSSPGVFRALRERRHFEQSIGKMVRLTLAPEVLPEHRQRTVRGVLAAVQGESLRLELPGEGGAPAEVLELPLESARNARLDPDL
jgi:ribosome maturation factor RimP